MKRSKITFLLVLLMSMACIHVNAHDIAVDNNGQTIYYNFVDNTTELSVTHSSNSSTKYTGDVVIPASVTYNGTTYSVTSIGNFAFSECSGLNSIVLSDNLLDIGNSAFNWCTGLTSIILPNSLLSIGGSAFNYCTGLTRITIPENVQTIGNSAFYGCNGLKCVDLGCSLVSIGDYAFSDCSNIISIISRNPTPPSATDYTFFNQTITTIYVPTGSRTTYQSVRPWGTQSFIDIIELKLELTPNIILFSDANVKALCVATWDINCDGELSEAEAAAVTNLGNVFSSNNNITTFEELQYFTGLSSIGDYTFLNCSFLTTVAIPSSVMTIGEGAFAQSGLTSVMIPDGVSSIGESAFYFCKDLTSVTIASSVTSIGTQAFQHCRGLTSFTVEWNTPISISSDVFRYSYYETSATLHIPIGRLSAYQEADVWQNFNKIEEPHESYTLNSLGKGTYCSEYDLDFTNVSGIKAYIISGFNPENGKLILTRAYEIPAGTGLYIDGTPSTTYNIPVKATAFYYSNMLKGVLASSTIPTYENGYTNYVLVPYGTDDVIFAHANDATLSANRAYVQIPTSIAGARSRLGIEIDDNTTGIEGVQTPDTEEAEGDYYNLNGQKVQNLKRGIYIRNGKKIIIH